MPSIASLEDEGLSLGLLVTTASRAQSNSQPSCIAERPSCRHAPQLKVLASLERHLGLVLARRALETQDNLLCGLCLLVEDGLCLTSVSRLFEAGEHCTTIDLAHAHSQPTCFLS